MKNCSVHVIMSAADGSTVKLVQAHEHALDFFVVDVTSVDGDPMDKDPTPPTIFHDEYSILYAIYLCYGERGIHVCLVSILRPPFDCVLCFKIASNTFFGMLYH